MSNIAIIGGEISKDKLFAAVILKNVFVNDPPSSLRVVTKITNPFWIKNEKDLNNLWLFHLKVCRKYKVKPTLPKQKSITKIQHSKGRGMLWGK